MSTQMAPAPKTPLENVLVLDAIPQRPSRLPDFARENRALRELAQQMPNEPAQMLRTLAQAALELCDAGSAGVSVLEQEEDGRRIFRWVALAGKAAEYRNGTTPAEWSPCGVCLARGKTTLFHHPERHFTYFEEKGIVIVEGLVVPMRALGRDIGTIWVMHHDDARRFDAEDVRVLEGLAGFTAAALDLQRSRSQAEIERLKAVEALHRAKRTEQELRTSEEFIRSVLESSPDCVKVLDLAGRILSINRTGCRLMEMDDLSQCVHQPWIKFWQGDGGDAAGAALSMAQAGSTGRFQGYCPTLKGTAKWWDVIVSPVRDASGNIVRLLSVSRDITAKKQAELEREQLLRELRRSNEELAAFSFIASHDLQSPLRRVSSFAQLLRRRLKDSLDERSVECLAHITVSVRRMQDLIDSLLRYAQFGAGPVQRNPADLNEVIRDVLTLLRPAIEESAAEVTCEALPTVEAESVQLSQLFQNLIGNALKYRHPSRTPRICISAKQVDREWQFSVSDNGEGIDGNAREQIFAPLKRLHGDDIAGTGIGLAICKKIVERHGGRIWVESERGVGSTFFFTLP